MKIAHSAEKGAIGLEGEMIDAPMIKQVLQIELQNENTRLTVLRQRKSSKSQRPLVSRYPPLFINICTIGLSAKYIQIHTVVSSCCMIHSPS